MGVDPSGDSLSSSRCALGTSLSGFAIRLNWYMPLRVIRSAPRAARSALRLVASRLRRYAGGTIIKVEFAPFGGFAAPRLRRSAAAPLRGCGGAASLRGGKNTGFECFVCLQNAL